MSRNKKNLELARELLSPPGDTIQETIDALGMSQRELAERMGRPVKTVNEIIQGKEALTPETAIQLEHVLGIPSDFWLERESRYVQALKSLERQEALQQWEESWLTQFPIKQMTTFGWLPKLTSKTETVSALLSFFGVASPEEWKTMYIGNHVHQAYYRISLIRTPEHAALSAWLRQGEMQAKEFSLAPYNQQAFVMSLPTIRQLACVQPADYIDQLQKLCLNAGVAVVYTACLPKTSVSGVARWINGGQNPLIQLSGRYKSNDQFWFSFFHEAGHILKHGKKDFFIEGVEDIPMDAEKEHEADTFAANFLIPANAYKSFEETGDFSTDAILAFAEKIKMHPGIVAGRLSHDGCISFAGAAGWKVRVGG